MIMKTPKILVVEDKATISTDLQEQLAQLGYEIVDVVVDTQTAIQKVRSYLPDIVIMDIHIGGGKDGIETAAEIRLKFSIPVIYVIVQSEEATLQRAKASEPFGYLFLPLHTQELQSTIELALDKYKTECKLRETEAQLNKVQLIAQMGYWALDLTTNNLSWSDELYRIFEIDPQKFDATYNAFLKIIHPDDRELVDQAYTSSFESHSPYGIDYRLLMADGRIKFVREQGETFYDRNGKPLRLLGTIQDTTERVVREDAHMRLATIIESLPDFVVTTDTNGKVMYCNRAVRALLGIDGYEDISDSLVSVLHPVPIKNNRLPSYSMEGKWLGETIFRDNYGRDIPLTQMIISHMGSNGKMEALSMISRDVSELNIAERFASKRAAELATVAEISTSISSILDIEMLLQITVDLTKTRFGFYHAHIYLLNENGDSLILAAGAGRAGRLMMEKGHAIPISHEPSIVARTARTQHTIIANNITQTPDFLPHPLLPETQSEMSIPLIFGNQFLGILDLQSDQPDRFSNEDEKIQITLAAQIATAIQNARNHQQLIATVAHLEAVQNAINTGAILTITDAKGRIEFVNDNFVHTSKYTREELLGNNHRILKSEIHPDSYFKNLWQTISSGNTWRGEICNRAKDGSLYWLDSTIVPVLDKGGNPIKYLAVRMDITDRKRMEDDLFARKSELETLFSISSHLRAAQVPDDMWALIFEDISSIFNIEAGAIMLMEEKDEQLIYVYAVGSLVANIGRRIPRDASISQKTLQMLAPWVTTNLSEESSIGTGVDQLGQALCVPIRSETKVLGGLMIAWENRVFTPNLISEENIRLLEAIGEMTGNALRRIRLYGDAIKRMQQLEAMLSISTAMTSSLDPHQILHILLIETINQLNVDAASLLLFNSDNQRLEYYTGRGFRTNAIKETSLLLGEDRAGQAAYERRTISISNLPQDTLFKRTRLIEDEGFHACACSPLIARGKLIGVLEIFRRIPLADSQEWLNYLNIVVAQTAISLDNANLFESLQHSNTDLIHAYDATILGWSRALELREYETNRHTERVTEMTIRLARTMKIPENELIHIRRGALLHDIGKMGTPDNILLKSEKLTEEEWNIMRMHPQHAYEMLKPIRHLMPALDIPYCHHERWDGTGYPRGLIGEEIPVAARIFSICDVWDALTNDRPYRKAWSKKKTLSFIHEQSGKHFDPDVVKAFEDLLMKDGD